TEVWAGRAARVEAGEKAAAAQAADPAAAAAAAAQAAAQAAALAAAAQAAAAQARAAAECPPSAWAGGTIIPSGKAPPLSPRRTDYSVGNGPIDIAVGNLNADAFPDIASANFGADTITLLFNDGGNGAFLPQLDIPAGAGPYSIVAADFDMNGQTDLAVVNAKS